MLQNTSKNGSMKYVHVSGVVSRVRLMQPPRVSRLSTRGTRCAPLCFCLRAWQLITIIALIYALPRSDSAPSEVPARACRSHSLSATLPVSRSSASSLPLLCRDRALNIDYINCTVISHLANDSSYEEATS